LGLVEAQIELIDRHLYEIEMKRKGLSEKKVHYQRQDCPMKNKIPVTQYLPPYFKDENMMCPPLNEEAKHKLRYTTFDPLIKEDKKCGSDLFGTWTKEELERLKQLREESFTSWAALAKKLGTDRTPYQCFEKYRTVNIYLCGRHCSREWTKEEDDRLVALVKIMTVNDTVQWDKVCFYMPGRSRQQVRTRYQRTLDENVRHGRWTDHEDLLLMSAVAQFGAKDWTKVAKCVVGRSDGQCRERWCNVLDRCTETNDWMAEEDERLVLGVQVFGRGQWAKIAEILPRHKPENIRRRYRHLLSTKMRVGGRFLSTLTLDQVASCILKHLKPLQFLFLQRFFKNYS
uniref:snRNA-activating protein complex subunit 4 n=1 Tax=Angiostrongylus cantonensis TaxID=6313 RepID=A0A158P7Q2_ANGCA